MQMQDVAELYNDAALLLRVGYGAMAVAHLVRYSCAACLCSGVICSFTMVVNQGYGFEFEPLVKIKNDCG